MKKYRLPKRLPRPKAGASAFVELDAPSRRQWSLLTEMPQRLKAITRMVPFIAAHELLRGVTDRIPGGPRWARYRSSLTLSRVRGAPRGNSMYAVHGEPRATQNQNIETERHVIYVRPKRSFAAPVPPEVRLLHKYSPWTAETLPFSPKRNEAVLVLRRVSRREVQRVTAQRQKDQPEWRKQLEAAGVRNVNLTKKPVEVKTKVINDLGFDALRLEFGYGGAKPTPHWRPSLYAALEYVKSLIRRRSLFSNALTNARSFSWRKWPPRVESSIKFDAIRDFDKFQRRVAVQV